MLMNLLYAILLSILILISKTTVQDSDFPPTALPLTDNLAIMPRIANIRSFLVKALYSLHKEEPIYRSAQVVFNIDDLAASIMENITDLHDLLSFIRINQTTTNAFKQYHRTSLVRCLRLLNPLIGEIAFSILLSDVWRTIFQRNHLNGVTWLFSARLQTPAGRWGPLPHPLHELQLLTDIDNSIEATIKALRQPMISRYLPYRYNDRTHSGSLTVLPWTERGQEAQRAIDSGMELALWRLHLYNELWYAKSTFASRAAEDLRVQTKFMIRWFDQDAVELYNVFRALYRGAQRLKEPVFVMLVELLRIGEQGLRSEHEVLGLGLGRGFVMRHLVYQLSVGLPLLPWVFWDPERAITNFDRGKCEDGLSKEGLVQEAVEMHLGRAAQRKALWGYDTYRLKRMQGCEPNHVQYEFF